MGRFVPKADKGTGLDFLPIEAPLPCMGENSKSGSAADASRPKNRGDAARIVIASDAMEMDETFMGDIVFDGLGPFMLPVATAVGAIPARDRVEISLRVQTAPKRQETILITVSVNQAVELAALLNAASGNALRSASSS
jgi:hypothetical protein